MTEHTTGTEKPHHHLLYSHAGPDQGPGLDPANQNLRISGATIKKVVKSSGDDLLDEIFANGKSEHKSFILHEKDSKDHGGSGALTECSSSVESPQTTRPPTAPISVNRSEVKHTLRWTMITMLLVRLCFAIVHIFTSIINIYINNMMVMIYDDI